MSEEKTHLTSSGASRVRAQVRNLLSLIKRMSPDSGEQAEAGRLLMLLRKKKHGK